MNPCAFDADHCISNLQGRPSDHLVLIYKAYGQAYEVEALPIDPFYHVWHFMAVSPPTIDIQASSAPTTRPFMISFTIFL